LARTWRPRPLGPDLPVFGNANEDDAVKQLLDDIIQNMDIEIMISLVDVLGKFRAPPRP
jgi:hypothetical protein